MNCSLAFCRLLFLLSLSDLVNSSAKPYIKSMFNREIELIVPTSTYNTEIEPEEIKLEEIKLVAPTVESTGNDHIKLQQQPAVSFKIKLPLRPPNQKSVLVTINSLLDTAVFVRVYYKGNMIYWFPMPIDIHHPFSMPIAVSEDGTQYTFDIYMDIKCKIKRGETYSLLNGKTTFSLKGGALDWFLIMKTTMYFYNVKLKME